MNNDNIKCIEDFLMDIEILDVINTKISKFNAFETLGIVNNEIRHSNVLAWLFNPVENHGLDDIFLKKFVQKLVYNNRDVFLDKNECLDLVTISLMNYHNFMVRREYKNIDILICSEKDKFLIVIENKIWSKESKHQLNKYREIIEDEFKGYKKIYLFLTPDGDIPSDEENWNVISYEMILEVLEVSLKLKSDEIGDSVRYFIEQYLTMLRRHVVKNSELEKICGEIYLKHKKALDLIFEYKPDMYQDISNYIKELIIEKEKNGEGIYLDNSIKKIVRFSTLNFDEKIPKDGVGWTKTKNILLYEIQLSESKLQLRLYIGPTDNIELKNKLFDLYKLNKKTFNGKVDKLNAKWTTIYMKDFIKSDFIEKYREDSEDLFRSIKNEFEKFLNGDFIKINEIIRNSDL